MARSREIPVRNYSAGTYGPFAIDSFTQDDIQRVQVSLTFENRPASSVEAGSVYLAWDVEDTTRKMVVNIPSSAAVDKGGNANPTVVLSFGLPRIGDGKKVTSSGEITFVATRSLRCSLAAEAL